MSKCTLFYSFWDHLQIEKYIHSFALMCVGNSILETSCAVLYINNKTSFPHLGCHLACPASNARGHWELCASAPDACREVTAGWVAGQLWQLPRLLMYQHMDSVLIPAEAHNYRRTAAAFPFCSVSLTLTWMSSCVYFCTDGLWEAQGKRELFIYSEGLLHYEFITCN